MTIYYRGEITAYHTTMGEEEDPQLPLSEEEREVLRDVAGGETCAYSIAPVGHRNRGIIRRLLRRGYLGSCSVAGCRARHYYIDNEPTT